MLSLSCHDCDLDGPLVRRRVVSPERFALNAATNDVQYVRITVTMFLPFLLFLKLRGRNISCVSITCVAYIISNLFPQPGISEH